MKPIVIDKDGEIINATDWMKKSEDIIQKLDETLFKGITEEDSYNIKYNKFGEEIGRSKKKIVKNEVMPLISPAQVATKLNRLLRVYRPMTTAEAKELADTDYLEAYGYYLDIISHINQYCTYIGSKQEFSAFCNINTETYNTLLGESGYAQVFASIEDGFIQSNFTVAQSGLVDTKTTIAKLQSKDVGHSVTKANEFIRIENFNQIDKQQVLVALDKFDSMTKKLPTNKG